MSAPKTNIEKQTRRHKPSVIGISVAVIAAVVILVVVFAWPTPPLDTTEEPPAGTTGTATGQ